MLRRKQSPIELNRKTSLIGLCLMLLLCIAFLNASNIKADTGSQDQVPAPEIQTTTITSGTAYGTSGTYLGGYVMSFMHGTDFYSRWSVEETTDAQNGLVLGWQGNNVLNISGTEFDFQFTLSSSTTNAVNTNSIYVNCSGEIIPIYLYNCSSYDMTVSGISYIDNVPTFTNTITFHDIAIETYGQGSSSITLTFTQYFIANWTQLTVKTETYADLTNMKLYYSNHTAVPSNTDFSLNLDYMVCLSNLTANESTFIYPSSITQTGMYFDVNGTEGMQYTVADLTLADNYNELQGDTQITNKTATACFEPGWASGCICMQSFTNLTYGLTTAIQSDPTVNIQHSTATASQNSRDNQTGPEWMLVALGIVGISAVVIATVAIVVKKKRKHESSVK